MIDAPSELAALIEKHTEIDGEHTTAIPWIRLYRATEVSQYIHTIQEPSLCLMAQGRKVVLMGTESYTYDPDHFLLVSVGLPLAGRVIEASRAKPYLSLRIDIAPSIVSALVVENRGPMPPLMDPRALSVNTLDEALKGAAVRLLKLLDTPDHIPALSPLILKEILYLLLIGPEGGRLTSIAMSNGQVHRIAAAIDLLRREFNRPLRIEDVAREAGMSASGLHHQFKAVTAMSPLQFQKHIRLQEARRLMIGENMDAASACFQVGYESPSQFSREYRRLFGMPPTKDVAKIRAMQTA